MITIGNYTYSERTEEKLRRVDTSKSSNLVHEKKERRGREYMISERLKIDYFDIYTSPGLKGFEVRINPTWRKVYSEEEFYAGRAEFVEQVMLDYTFGVID